MFDTFLGCSTFLLMNFSLAYASHLVVRRFTPYAPVSVRLVSTGLVFYAFIIIIFQLLSPFHAITKTGVSISCLAVALSAHLMWSRHRDFQADLQPLRVWVRDGLSSRWAVLIVICGFVVLVSLSRALLMPPLAWDSLTYHLTFAALWIQKGTLMVFQAPDQMQTAYFPINGELFSAWLLLPFHSDLIVNAMNFPLTLLGGISCYALARELGLSRKESSWAPALICFAPMIYSLITTAYTDTAVFAFSVASVLFALRFMKTGVIYEAFFSLVAAGIVLGTKYNSIPLVGLIVTAVFIKMFMVKHKRLLLKVVLLLVGLMMLCMLGGRQYINNTIVAGNPIYPFPFKIFNQTIFSGWSQAAQVEKAVSAIVPANDKMELLKTELSKFCYRTMSAGPKFPLFFILAVFALCMTNTMVSKRYLYFLTFLWVVPVVTLYLDTSSAIAKQTDLTAVNTRYFAPYIALFTIQGLVVIRKIRNQFKAIDFFLVLLVVWDLFHANTSHIKEVAALYPVAVLMVPLMFLFYRLSIGREAAVIKRWGVYATGFVMCTGALCFLQIYRDNTRYIYYQNYTDLHSIPTDYVAAWKLLDTPDEKKTIALTKGWDPLLHTWFFYPLMGSRLQNDIMYLSAKYRDAAPTRFDRGSLRGNDISIWRENVRQNNVDYILAQKPWPIELGWMTDSSDEFLLIAEDKKWKIFRCRTNKSETNASGPSL